LGSDEEAGKCEERYENLKKGRDSPGPRAIHVASAEGEEGSDESANIL
jgi:hypothetical protein